MSLNLENLQQSAYVDGQGGLHIVPVNDTKMIHFSLSSFSADSLQTSLDVTSSPLHSKVIKRLLFKAGLFVSLTKQMICICMMFPRSLKYIFVM